MKWEEEFEIIGKVVVKKKWKVLVKLIKKLYVLYKEGDDFVKFESFNFKVKLFGD